MTNKYIMIAVALLCLHHYASAQIKQPTISDSLSAKDYEYFNKKINYKEKDNSKEISYAQSWLAKAKKEKNFTQMAMAYKALIYINNKKTQLIYADSMVTAAKHSTHIELIGSAYMTKGIIYYDRKEQGKALENFIIADEYISKTSNKYLIYKVKYGIGQIKYYLGFYDEAISLIKECVDYYKGVNELAYLNSLHSLGLCYNRIGKYEHCSQMNQMGLREGLRLKNLEMQSYFIESEGINQYFKHNYKDAVNKLKNVLPTLKHNKDFANETIAYFYIGKCYWSQKLPQKALPYFKKIDEAFQKQNYIRPDLREAYKILINYHKQQNNLKQQLYYSSTLVKVDEFLAKDYKYLSRKIDKEYDTKKLLQTQRFRTIIGCIIIVIMAVTIVFFVCRHFKHKRLFKELMNPKPNKPKPLVSAESHKETELDISPEIATTILKNLEKFELKKRYLEKDMTLAKMASILNTNTKYVTKIIVRYRGKGTIEYISDLKIDHIVELLKNENKYRNYTNKALGEEAGFGSTQNFTRAFNNRTGLSPTYFIKKLKNQ